MAAGPPPGDATVFPRLVLVSGAPGSGKSTLAAHIATALSLPLLSKDAFKVVLAETIGASNIEDSFKLGAAAVAILLHTATAVLRGGSGVVIESAFLKGVSESELAPILGLGSPRLLRCVVPADMALARYHARERHWVHFDQVRGAEFSERIAAGEFDLHLDVPTLEVDTSDGYRPAMEEIVSFAKEA